jgi:alkylation response protein AidB-like acyl-CoA dehydrogenase
VVPDIFDRVDELVPIIAKRSDDIEAARNVPADLVAALREAGLLRMLVPARHGGSALPVPTVLRVLEELGAADGSTAWVVGQVALSQLIIGCTPDTAMDEVYADGPDVFAAGAVAPKGRATAAGDGWRITGQWPYVTGSTHASWFYLNCVVVRDRAVVMSGELPSTRIVLVPAADVEIVDTWRVLGLRGTGSHNVRTGGAECPAYRGFGLEPDDPATPRAMSRIAQSSLIIAAVAVGCATGALTEIRQLATAGKRPALSTRSLARSALFQDRLGEAHTILAGARAHLRHQARIAGDDPLTAVERATIRATAARIIASAAAVVDTAHAVGGGTTAYDTSPLQRRLRDIHTATQHFVAGRDSYATLGAMLVGEQPETGPL